MRNESRNFDGQILSELVGPFYNEVSLTAYLSIPPAELEALVESGQVLATRLGDGSFVYPTFQFEDGQILPRLSEIKRESAEWPSDDWSLAMQLNETVPAWGDRTAAQLLRTEWADEVQHQIVFGERLPLDERGWKDRNGAIATVILGELELRIVDLPVKLLSTAITLEEKEGRTTASVSVTSADYKTLLGSLVFNLDRDPAEEAAHLAENLASRFGADRSG